MTFEELFRGDPFNLLEDGPTYALSGLCGRIWTVHGDFATLSSPDEFLTWREPGTVRVLFANWAEATDDGPALVSEVRVAAVDRKAALEVRALEPFIAASQGVVAAEPLSIAVHRAASDSESRAITRPAARRVSASADARSASSSGAASRAASSS